jgi:siroheme synthase
MIAYGVRLLFVAKADGVLHGLVTFTDLFGEKPVQYIQQHGGSREEILAQDIMTPLAQLEALQQNNVLRAKVGDIVETIKAAGRQHMLVSHTYADGRQVVTGLFSSTQIEKLLGIEIELSPRAQTFADLERALS